MDYRHADSPVPFADLRRRRARQREITAEMGEIAVLIYWQWWRLRENRKRRARMAELLEESRKLR